MGFKIKMPKVKMPKIPNPIKEIEKGVNQVGNAVVNTTNTVVKSTEQIAKDTINSAKNIAGLFIFFSFMICLVCFFIFLGKFPLNIFFLVSAIFFGYLVSYIN